MPHKPIKPAPAGDTINPIETATIEELIAELERRSTALVVVIETREKGTADAAGLECVAWWKHTTPIGAIGYLEWAKGNILDNVNGGGKRDVGNPGVDP